MFCSKCGKEIHDEAVVCVHCGCSVPKNSTIESTIEEAAVSAKAAIISEAASAKAAISELKPRQEKSGLVALILCFFFGALGIHRFYSGHIAIGLIQLFTFGGCLIWCLIDLLIILTGAYSDSDGAPMKL